eukprot:1236921-Amphidinium_carterae.1
MALETASAFIGEPHNKQKKTWINNANTELRSMRCSKQKDKKKTWNGLGGGCGTWMVHSSVLTSHLLHRAQMMDPTMSSAG